MRHQAVFPSPQCQARSGAGAVSPHVVGRRCDPQPDQAEHFQRHERLAHERRREEREVRLPLLPRPRYPVSAMLVERRELVDAVQDDRLV
jgi:hypothetical protein